MVSKHRVRFVSSGGVAAATETEGPPPLPGNDVESMGWRKLCA